MNAPSRTHLDAPRARLGTLLAAMAAALALALGGSLAAPSGADAAYAAMAFNVNPASGNYLKGAWAAKYPSRRPAVRAAKRRCPGKCTRGLWVRNASGAMVAALTQGGQVRLFHGIAKSRAKAKQRAQRRARKVLGNNLVSGSIRVLGTVHHIRGGPRRG